MARTDEARWRWRFLVVDILLYIAQKVGSYIDLDRFRAERDEIWKAVGRGD